MNLPYKIERVLKFLKGFVIAIVLLSLLINFANWLIYKPFSWFPIPTFIENIWSIRFDRISTFLSGIIILVILGIPFIGGHIALDKTGE